MQRVVPLLPLLLLPASLGAQTLTGSLQGTVTDESGAALPGAAVALRNESLTLTQTATADAAGAFRFLRLPPGAGYRLSVTAPNFGPFEKTGIEILSGETCAAVVTLQIAARSDTLVVTEIAAPLTTDSPDVAQTIDRRRLNTLPSNAGS